MASSEQPDEYEFPSKDCFICLVPVPLPLLEGREGDSGIWFQKPPKFKRLPTTHCIHDSVSDSCNQKQTQRF